MPLRTQWRMVIPARLRLEARGPRPVSREQLHQAQDARKKNCDLLFRDRGRFATLINTKQYRNAQRSPKPYRYPLALVGAGQRLHIEVPVSTPNDDLMFS